MLVGGMNGEGVLNCRLLDLMMSAHRAGILHRRRRRLVRSSASRTSVRLCVRVCVKTKLNGQQYARKIRKEERSKKRQGQRHLRRLRGEFTLDVAALKSVVGTGTGPGGWWVALVAVSPRPPPPRRREAKAAS